MKETGCFSAWRFKMCSGVEARSIFHDAPRMIQKNSFVTLINDNDSIPRDANCHISKINRGAGKDLAGSRNLPPKIKTQIACISGLGIHGKVALSLFYSFICSKITGDLVGFARSREASAFCCASKSFGALFGYRVSMPHEKCFVKWLKATTLKIYKSFTLWDFYVGEKE